MIDLNALQVSGLVLLAVLAGGLLMGIDRKITARLQSRMGPPITQAFWDVTKLLAKEPVATGRVQALYAYITLLFTLAATAMLISGRDPLLAVFVLAGGNLTLVLGALSVRSPYSRIGSYREILAVLAVEPLLIFVAVGLYLASSSFLANRLGAGRPLLFSLPFLYVAYVLVLPAKLRKSPFDISAAAHAHQEIVGGIYTEYSGPSLALLELAHWTELSFLMLIGRLFWAPGWEGWALSFASLLAVIIADNTTARLSWRTLLTFAWAAGFLLAAANLVWLWIH